ncbi:MAG: hypothetical protein ABIT09_05015 [Croceibacterium sp.]
MEYLLGDIITTSHGIGDYSAIRERLPHRVERRIAKVHQILEIDGFFSAHRDEINWVIDAFESHHQTRNLLAHGFCTAYHTPDGDFGLEFRKWHRDGDNDRELIQTFRLIDLEYEKAQLTDLSQRALHLAFRIHDELGLVGP